MLICKSSEKHFQFHASRSPRWNLGNSSVICKDHKFECNLGPNSTVREMCGIWFQAISKASTVFLIERQGTLTHTIFTTTWVEILCLKINYKIWSCGRKIWSNPLSQLKGAETYLHHLKWKPKFPEASQSGMAVFPR